MRVARQLCLERLACLDIEQDAPLATITGCMTALAEATLELALAQALADAQERHGAPLDAQGRPHRVLDRRHGQARRARVERVLRHRPDLCLRGRGRNSRSAAHQRARVLCRRGQAAVHADRRDHRRRLRLPRRPGAAPQRQLRPAGVQPADAGGVPSGAGPRVGAFCLAEEPRGGAARQRGQRARAGAARTGHALRLPPLSGLRRVRRPAPVAPQDPRRSAAPRRRAARARQRREAVARRHPRDRVHRAVDAGRARRAVPGNPHALDLEEPAAPGRARADEAGHRRAAGRVLHLPAPCRAPHPVPGRPADAPAADGRCRPGLDRRAAWA